MKKLQWVVLFLYAQVACAALPPRYQNTRDLDVIVAFIKKHAKVSATLEQIDLQNYAIYFGHGCKVIFGRRVSIKPLGWVGPADPLEFKSSNCDISHKNK